jgi:hypothetical protein
MISNLEIWNGLNSPDDSKHFYENYKDINEKKKDSKFARGGKKKNMNKKNYLEVINLLNL